MSTTCKLCPNPIGPGVNGPLCRVCIWNVEIPVPRLEPRVDHGKAERDERRETEEAIIRTNLLRGGRTE